MRGFTRRLLLGSWLSRLTILLFASSIFVLAYPDQARAAQAAFDAGDRADLDTELDLDLDHDLDLEADPFAEACAPLKEARDLLARMQPRANAHLPKKLGGVSPSTGLGDELGWGHDGPLSTAFRLMPRVLANLNPLNHLARLPSPSSRRRVSAKTRERAERLFGLIRTAEEAGCPDAALLRGDIRMFPPRGVKQDLAEAYTSYMRFLETGADAHTQFLIGFFHATGLGGAVRDQAKATLYYTFAALQGHKSAQMAMGYRYWTGISVKEDCNVALDYYESAAKNAYDAYLAGPPGGTTLLLTRTRLSDRYGGVFGPYASWASTGANGNRMTIRAIKAAATGESEAEVLEYFQYHSDRDSLAATVRLGRFFYHGSVYPHRAGIASGAEGVSEIPQDFAKARRYFYNVARRMWPQDFDAKGNPGPKKSLTKETEERIQIQVRDAATFLGRMALRGEGMAQDFDLAHLWYERAATLHDPEAYNGLGIMYRDGLGVTVNRDKAQKFFELAARLQLPDQHGQLRYLPDAQVNLARMYIEKGELNTAFSFLKAAQGNGSPFEAFHLLATLFAQVARTPGTPPSGGECGVAVSYFKLVSELGAWGDDYLGDADRAWGRGEEHKALLGWWIAAEMGYEAGQNNVAFLMSRGIRLPDHVPADTSLALWTRSAAQGNADAMVMVGDYYYRGDLPSENNTTSGPDFHRAFEYYQTAADKSSAMAFWNLGYMYENGQGVKRDWHLAKRNYDFSLEASHDAYFPWMLSLTKLYLRSWWTDLRTNGAVPGLPLFEDDAEGLGLWESVKGLFVGPVLEDGGEAADEYEDYSGAGWGPGEEQGGGALDEFDDDLVETLVMLALTGLIMGLVWLRGRWVRAAQAQ